jgi:Domain of unknown function (DUF4917)
MTPREDIRAAARDAYEQLPDDTLAPWDLVMRMHDWAGILLGNGASLAVWNSFAYTSLYDTACSNTTGQPLPAEDRAIFDALETTNFESVLAGLRTTALINDAIGTDPSVALDHYDAIRESLVAAVHAVHVPWLAVSAGTLEQIKQALCAFDFVFTTNYDLITYWAAMSEAPGDMPDYFWSREHSCVIFDPLNVDVWNKATKLLWLHGGLHLLHLADGRAAKRVAPSGWNLLEVFGEPDDNYPGAVPLFVSEGTADDKMAAIRRSEYLRFALTEFSRFDRPLVVFGHSLSDQDRHLVDILRTSRRPIALSLRQAEPEALLAKKNELRGRLHQTGILFFDAATHPLGNPDLAAEGA